MSSLKRACPNASSFLGGDLGSDPLLLISCVSEIVGENEVGLGLSFGEGRARDAVVDSIGVASDDDSTAGTDDFANLARRAARLAAGELEVAACARGGGILGSGWFNGGERESLSQSARLFGGGEAAFGVGVAEALLPP